MYINEIAKEMTREEFINEYSTGAYCPKDYNLKEHEDCGNGCTCHKCWKNAIKNIKFKEEKMPKDYEKEYSIQEVFKFEEGTEFLHKECMYRVVKGFLEINCYKIENKWDKCDCVARTLINAKFKLVKKDKEVPFLEAVKAYHKGETIYCILQTSKFIYRGCSWDANFMLKEKSKCSVSAVEILEGKWFIKA